MRNVIAALLLTVLVVVQADAQRAVTATIKNFNRTGTDFTFDIYARSTGSPTVNLGWTNFFFYFNSSALGTPSLLNINSKFTGDSTSQDYAPMRVSIVNSNPARLGVQIYYTGAGSGTGQALETAGPDGERICTVRLLLTNANLNSDISWDAGGAYANTWVLSKDTVAVGNTINGVGFVTRDVDVANRWNMVSVPVVAVDMRKVTLFPTAITPAYAYNGVSGYSSPDTLVAGRGYWIKFGAADTFTVFGAKVTPSNIAVIAKWNMVGPLDFNARVAGITTTPSGIIVTPFYGYNSGSYSTPDTLKPGKGYWVKTSQAGTFNLAGAAAKIGVPASSLTANWVCVEVEDAAGMKGTLYLAKREEMQQSYELPPPSPAGILDVRFASNTFAEPLGEGTHVMQLSSVVLPFKLRATNLNGLSLRVKDNINGSLLDETLKEGSEVAVTLNLSQIEIHEIGQISKQLPTTFELNQNYPNPFNPTTIIKFALPKDVRVSVAVYNIIGEKVADIVEGDYVAGYHQVEFNATNLASGMYLYKIEAGGFVQSKKMLILK